MFAFVRSIRWLRLWLALSLALAPPLQAAATAAPSPADGHAAHHATVAADAGHAAGQHPPMGVVEHAQHATSDCGSHDGCSALCCVGCAHHAGTTVVPLPALGIDHPLMTPRVPQFHPDSLVLPREHPPRLLSV